MRTADKVSILGSNISVWNLDETVQRLRDLAADGGRHYVCVSNVHTVVMGLEERDYCRVTNNATLATADGVPLVWASKILGGPSIRGRSSGPDILLKIARDPSCRHLRHYFYGSSPSVLEAMQDRLAILAPEMKLAGFYSPPKRDAHSLGKPLDSGELEDCARIDAAKPDIVWVGLGAPKQELWMARARASLNAPILIGVGAAFDFIAGSKKRAPEWMQSVGLEWAYRFMQEPRRLASRYLKTNPIFIVEVAKRAVFRGRGV